MTDSLNKKVDFSLTQLLISCIVRIEDSVVEIFGVVHFRISASLDYVNTRKSDIL
jgi:hypothetical protein